MILVTMILAMLAIFSPKPLANANLSPVLAGHSYDYIHKHPVEGYKAGLKGFSSSNGELSLLVDLYCEKKKTELCKFQLKLNSLAEENSGKTIALGESFETAFRAATQDKDFRDLQDELAQNQAALSNHSKR